MAPPRPNKIELNNALNGQNIGGAMSRVVVVRKTDQRIFACAKDGGEPKYETVTKETYVTYRGNKTERKFTSVETKQDVPNQLPLKVKNGLPRVAPVHTPIKSENRKNNDEAAFQAECLDAHNEYRIKHGVPALKLSKKMCQVSKEWANKLAVRGKLQHSNNKEYGENIFYCWSSDPNNTVGAREPVESWYNEIKDHVFGTEPNSLQTGHFTQVVWKDSKELGVGCTKSKDGKIYVVANYYPPGNYVGQYVENVPPVGGFRSGSVTDIDSLCSGIKSLASSSKSSSGGDNDADFEEECLQVHNDYRVQHGAQPLKLNKKMCKESKEWAKYLASKGIMEHKPSSGYGENIFSCWSSNPNHNITGKEPVDKWYEEISVHNFCKEPSDLRSGHFTQVVWKGSREFGVGMARNRNGQIFVVANYYPPGNYVGSFCTNVSPKGSACQSNSVSSSENTESEISGDFDEQAVEIHNEYRRKHGVPDLKLSRQICDYAQVWADSIAVEGKLTHRPNCLYGENIFMMWSSDPNAVPTAREVCKKWYDEINDYTFQEVRGLLKSGHFTQMVWKESTEMGIAMAKSKNTGKTFVVANYNPKGNYIGQFVKNVPRPIQ